MFSDFWIFYSSTFFCRVFLKADCFRDSILPIKMSQTRFGIWCLWTPDFWNLESSMPPGGWSSSVSPAGRVLWAEVVWSAVLVSSKSFQPQRDKFRISLKRSVSSCSPGRLLQTLAMRQLLLCQMQRNEPIRVQQTHLKKAKIGVAECRREFVRFTW